MIIKIMAIDNRAEFIFEASQSGQLGQLGLALPLLVLH